MNASGRHTLFRGAFDQLPQREWPLSQNIGLLLHIGLTGLKYWFGVCCYLTKEDRCELEINISAYCVADSTHGIVLIIGRSRRIEDYNNPSKRAEQYGSFDGWLWERGSDAKPHIVDDLQWFERHFVSGALDLIVCKGALGREHYGPTRAERLFATRFEALRRGDVLFVKWNDVEARFPFPSKKGEILRTCKSPRFAPSSTAESLPKDVLYGHPHPFCTALSPTATRLQRGYR